MGHFCTAGPRNRGISAPPGRASNSRRCQPPTLRLRSLADATPFLRLDYAPMALAPGTRLGPYEVLAPLGAGGMGEVYRARDTRLGRDVAVKVLPQHVSASPGDRARFKREAKTISSLNHPHICVLHDVGQEGETDFLVMELVEGETLAQRLARGPLPTVDVLKLGAQMADALDRAHRAGVIHRDLKPGNVMLTKSGAKLMDFGLARTAGQAGLSADDMTATAPGQPPRSDGPITAKGMVVGTLQYMAPEQLEGKRADARSDIWALGCVLYEMATGKRAFEGSTPASVISAIMRDKPRIMSELAPLAPPAFERAVKQCLAKDPNDRWQTAGDLRRELDWIQEAGSQAGVPAPVAARRRSRELFAWVLVVVVVASLVAVLLHSKHTPKPIIFELKSPAQVSSVDLPRISPDGNVLAFNATDSAGVSSIWVRQMNSVEARHLPGTEGASRPFWSPDSRYLAFFAGGKLMKIGVAGELPLTLCNAPRGADGTWSRRGVILFDGGDTDSIQMVSAAGGIPAGAASLDRTRQESGASWPQFLPDGQHFLYLAYGHDLDVGTLKVGSINSKETKTLGPAPSRTEYASGYLLYVSAGALVARRFDPAALEFKGEPVAVAQNVETERGGAARFSAALQGTLVYHSGASQPGQRLIWVSRGGDRLGTLGTIGHYDHAALSPDGTQLALTVGDWSRSNRSIWLWNISRNVGSRFTLSDQDANTPAWSPDGSHIVFSMKHGPGHDLFVQPVSGASGESLLYTSSEAKGEPNWSADGRWIVYMAAPKWEGPGTNFDIFALSVGDSARPVPVVATKFWDSSPALSPDGKLLAYASLEWDRWEVYVQSFPGPGGRRRISTRGGVQPAWRGDSRELYYLGLDAGLIAVAVEPGPPPRFSPPRKLFDAPVKVPSLAVTTYLPTRDGQRFLLVSPEGEKRVGATTVILNWPALLAEK